MEVFIPMGLIRHLPAFREVPEVFCYFRKLINAQGWTLGYRIVYSPGTAGHSHFQCSAISDLEA
jgi:hypothetical protein